MSAGGVAPDIDAVLFDVFGTLVAYDPRRTAHEYRTTHSLLLGWGVEVTYDAFLADWDAASEALEAAAAVSQVEFSMADAAAAFAERHGCVLAASQHEELGASFAAEWALHVQVVNGVLEMLRRVRACARVGVVSNTNDRDMVPALLDAMGVAGRVDVVVLSVDHGHRKPHPSIYAAALDRIGCPAQRAAFVGDSYAADYLGPRTHGMTALLIDPDGRHAVPADHRLASVLEVEERLGLTG